QVCLVGPHDSAVCALGISGAILIATPAPGSRVCVKKKSASTAPSKIRANALISRWTSIRIGVTAEKNVDTTVDAARLEARATKRNFMARAWAVGPWTLPKVAAPKTLLAFAQLFLNIVDYRV